MLHPLNCQKPALEYASPGRIPPIGGALPVILEIEGSYGNRACSDGGGNGGAHDGAWFRHREALHRRTLSLEQTISRDA